MSTRSNTPLGNPTSGRVLRVRTGNGTTTETQLTWCCDVDAAARMFHSMRRNGGGGNGGESSLEAVMASIDKTGRAGALRVVLLITDEPPLTHAIRPATVSQVLTIREVLCNVISTPLDAFQQLSRATGGTWLPIGSHVDMTSLVRTWGTLGEQIALRAARVVEIGGSPQRLLQLETGR
jgi:hypothetical protein